jgi:hypothetical protein
MTDMTVKPKIDGPVFDADGSELSELAVREPELATNPMLTLHSTRPAVDNIRLTQGTSAIGTPGTFMNVETGEEFKELAVIPFMIQATRTLWPKVFVRDHDPLCASDNGKVAVDLFASGGSPGTPEGSAKPAPIAPGAPLREWSAVVLATPFYFTAPCPTAW